MVMQAQGENLAKARKKAVNAIGSVINLTNYIVGGVFSKEIYSTYLPRMQRMLCDWMVDHHQICTVDGVCIKGKCKELMRCFFAF